MLKIHSNILLTMPSSSNPPTEHVWYFDADDDIPMGQPGSSEPSQPMTENGIQFALSTFLLAYHVSSHLVQCEGRGHRKKMTSRRMQESIQAEFAETAREAAEKRARKTRAPHHHVMATSEVSDEDDGSFVKSSSESSEDDEQEATVDNVEVSPDIDSFYLTFIFN